MFRSRLRPSFSPACLVRAVCELSTAILHKVIKLCLEQTKKTYLETKQHRSTFILVKTQDAGCSRQALQPFKAKPSHGKGMKWVSPQPLQTDRPTHLRAFLPVKKQMGVFAYEIACGIDWYAYRIDAAGVYSWFCFELPRVRTWKQPHPYCKNTYAQAKLA